MSQADVIETNPSPLQGSDYLRQILKAPVYEVAQVTPLQTMDRLSTRLNNHIGLKREDRQPVHSFKLRGAYNMMAQLAMNKNKLE